MASPLGFNKNIAGIKDKISETINLPVNSKLKLVNIFNVSFNEFGNDSLLRTILIIEDGKRKEEIQRIILANLKKYGNSNTLFIVDEMIMFNASELSLRIELADPLNLPLKFEVFYEIIS